MAAEERFVAPREVKITVGRWQVKIEITDALGRENVYYASADSGLTYGDNIFFGTAEEWKVACRQ